MKKLALSFVVIVSLLATSCKKENNIKPQTKSVNTSLMGGRDKNILGGYN